MAIQMLRLDCHARYAGSQWCRIGRKLAAVMQFTDVRSRSTRMPVQPGTSSTPTQPRIAIIGLGYVGLPPAACFGAKFDTVGFDIDSQRIEQLQQGFDRTRELTAEEFDHATRLTYTASADAIRDCNVYIVTVPTPIDAFKRPLLTPLQQASRQVGELLAPGDTVIYESTVYPGCTEEDCVPLLEQTSGLTFSATSTSPWSTNWRCCSTSWTQRRRQWTSQCTRTAVITAS